jgi:hypothetical protein
VGHSIHNFHANDKMADKNSLSLKVP